MIDSLLKNVTKYQQCSYINFETFARHEQQDLSVKTSFFKYNNIDCNMIFKIFFRYNFLAPDMLTQCSCKLKQLVVCIILLPFLFYTSIKTIIPKTIKTVFGGYTCSIPH